MICPYCGVDNDKVIDSRASDEGRAIRRRRVCAACNKRFTTYEHVERNTRMTVIKKDGTRVPYDRENVLTGVEKACFKRPVAIEQLAKLVDEVEEEIARTGQREISSMVIGDLVAKRLKAVDQVAYVRFASVYKQFRDIDDLLAEVREMVDNPITDSKAQGRLF